MPEEPTSSENKEKIESLWKKSKDDLKTIYNEIETKIKEDLHNSKRQTLINLKKILGKQTSTKFRKKNLIFMCFLTWFSSAFIFVQIPALAQEIKVEIFPSVDVVASVLMVAITLSVSLIARFIGGLVLGSYTNKNGIHISIYSIIILAILTGVQILLLAFKFTDNLFIVITVFLILRFLIGFFIGGIWPNLGIFTLEEIYRREQILKNEEFQKEVQQYGWESALIQTGLTISFLIELIAVLIISVFSDNLEQSLGGIVPTLNLLSIQFISIIGFVLLLLVFIYWFQYMRAYNNEHKEYYSEFLSLRSKYNSLKFLLSNKKYRFTLFHLWLIMTGLMYMYYSTVIVIPELLYRNSLQFPIQEEYIRIGIALSSVIGHIFLGFFYLRNKHKENKDDNENYDLKWIKKMSKYIMIIVGFYIIIIFLLPFYHDVTTTIYIMIIVQVSLAFLANSPWALIPSILTSRFPKHFRFLAGSLIYNGGLAFSFASPFLLQQVFISSKYDYTQSYFFSLFAMLLGGFSIWIGSRRLINDFLPNKIKRQIQFGYFEIRLPLEWNKSDILSYPLHIILDFKQINEYKILNSEEWMMSIYFVKNKNNQRFLDNEIDCIVRELVERKLEELVKVEEKGEEETYLGEIGEEEFYLNSILSTKKSYFIQGSEEILSILIIHYLNNVYFILYRDNPHDKINQKMSKVIDTFDIKIPLKNN